MPYSLKTEENGKKQSVKKRDKAETAAKFLAEKFWRKIADTEFRRGRIINEDLDYNIEEITLEELRKTINKFKRRKAPGPDEIPMEAFKEMDDENLEHLLKTLNEWWKHEEIPEEILEARIAMIFKKGDTSDLNNYRPIALLNSTYKIIASIIQNRIAEKLDEQL